MKKFYLILLAGFFFLLNQSHAQTNTCNAQFSVSITGNTIRCVPVLVGDPSIVHIWRFGDGGMSTLVEPVHTYTNCGPYTIRHVVQRFSPNGALLCSDSTFQAITILCPNTCTMQANFNFAPVPNQPNTISFTNTSQGFSAGDSIRWTFGDGTSSFDLNPVHTYTAAGTYNVCIRIKKNNLPPGTAPCVREFCRSVVISNPAPCNLVPSYTVTVANPNQPNVLVFTNTTATSTANTQVQWTFGDGSAGTGNVITHTYTQSGTYTVCIRVIQSNSCSADSCGPVTVTVPTNTCNLQANFSFAPVTSQPNTFSFTNTSSGFAAGDSIRWTFGDGSAPSFDLNPTHTFVAGGVYQVCLRIKKNNNPAGTAPCVREICRNVSVSVAGCNLNPTFTYQASPNQPNVITFTNTSITTNAPSVTWIFGDNSTGSGNSVTHTYNQPGVYRVCMRIAVSNTCASDTCITITVSGSNSTCTLAANFNWQTSPNTAPNVVYFQNASTGFAPGDSIRWSFGDGTGSTMVNPVHTYTAPGSYRVCLWVKKNGQPAGTPPCISETCRTINVTVPTTINCDSVRVRYTFVRDAVMPNKIYFITVSNYPVIQQSWTITALNNSSAPVTINQYNPAYIFNQTGNYRVCMRSVTQGNCVREYCDTISINSIATQCQLLAYPNPATSQVSVNAVLTAPSPINAFLYNSQNLMLQQVVRQGVAGSNIITFNTSTLPAGYYTIRLYYNGRVCISRFQKL